MIVSFSTFWGRVKRRKRVVFSCAVHSLEMAEALIGTAETLEQPLILVVKAESGRADALVAGVIRLASNSKSLCLIQVKASSIEKAEATLELPVQALELPDGALTSIHGLLRRRTSPGLAFALRTSLIRNHDDIVSTVKGHNLDALTLTVDQEHTTSPAASLRFLGELVKRSGVPVTLSAEDIRPSLMKRYLASGIQAFELDAVLEESFTAGLRTGLRDRAGSMHYEYLRYAQKAVRHTFEHYHQLANK